MASSSTQLGDDDPELAADIAEFRADELEHRDTARAAGATRAVGLSLIDRGDPCRLQGGNRPVEAHMRNPRRVSPAEPLERMRYAMKLIISLAATAALAGGLATLPAPALAQQAGSQSEVVVYGSDPCPRSTESNSRCLRPSPGDRALPPSQEPAASRYPPGTASLVEPCPRDLESRQDRHQQLFARRSGRLHGLPDPGDQPGAA